MTESFDVHRILSQRYRQTAGELSPFFAGLERHELHGTACPSCDRVFLPPRTRCPFDRTRTTWLEVTSHGRIIEVTSIGRRPRHAAPGPEELVLGLVQIDGVDTAVLAELVGEPRPRRGDDVTARFREPTNHPLQRLTFEVAVTDQRSKGKPL